MGFNKYTQTVIRLKRLHIELDYFIEPDENNNMIESESGLIDAIYEGSDGKDVVIRKPIDNVTDATDKTAITKFLKKIVKEAKKAL